MSFEVNPLSTHLLIRHEEISLKGKNRPEFERRLSKNIERCLNKSGSIINKCGRMFIHFDAPKKSILETSISKISVLGGVASIAPCDITDLNFESISTLAYKWFDEEVKLHPEAKTFAIRVKRVNKHFPISTKNIETEIGGSIKLKFPYLKTQLKGADIKIHIEIRNKSALIYSSQNPGLSGLPLDTSQRVICLLSGGIDSPVAAIEIMRRGCSPVLVHFHSKPFTSEATISKIKKLAKQIRLLSPVPVELWLISLTEIQKKIRDYCNPRLRTILYRRFMLKIAEELAHKIGAKAIVTGDALGQVASQTLSNIQAMDEATKLPILRPLIVMDKSQIIEKAKQFNTYETSILPHDDTCTLFAPDRPSTQAKSMMLCLDESKIDAFNLIFEALDSAEKQMIFLDPI